MARPVEKKEDELGKRWDLCITDGLMKIGGGLVVGAVSSIIVFRRRKWPVILGSGFGFGLAYGNCEKELKGVLNYSPVGERKYIEIHRDWFLRAYHKKNVEVRSA